MISSVRIIGRELVDQENKVEKTYSWWFPHLKGHMLESRCRQTSSGKDVINEVHGSLVLIFGTG